MQPLQSCLFFYFSYFSFIITMILLSFFFFCVHGDYHLCEDQMRRPDTGVVKLQTAHEIQLPCCDGRSLLHSTTHSRYPLLSQPAPRTLAKAFAPDDTPKGKILNRKMGIDKGTLVIPKGEDTHWKGLFTFTWWTGQRDPPPGQISKWPCLDGQ